MLNQIPDSVLEIANGDQPATDVTRGICQTLVALCLALDKPDPNWQLTIVPPEGDEWACQDEDGEWLTSPQYPRNRGNFGWFPGKGYTSHGYGHPRYPGPWTESLHKWVNGKWNRWDWVNIYPADPKDELELSDAVLDAIYAVEDDSSTIQNIARAAIAAYLAEYPIQPTAIPIEQCPEEFRNGGTVQVKLPRSRWHYAYWVGEEGIVFPFGIYKNVWHLDGGRFCSDKQITHVAPLPSIPEEQPSKPKNFK